MKLEEEQAVQKIFLEKYKAWQASQSSQTDAFEYEKSFCEMMQDLGQSLLSQATNRGAKKKAKK